MPVVLHLDLGVEPHHRREGHRGAVLPARRDLDPAVGHRPGRDPLDGEHLAAGEPQRLPGLSRLVAEGRTPIPTRLPRWIRS